VSVSRKHFEKSLYAWSQIKSAAKKIGQIFRSLNVSVPIKETEMGKNADEPACGTKNFTDPLPNILRSDYYIMRRRKSTIQLTELACLSSNSVLA